MVLSPGARLGPYAIVGPLGRGGMGEVYEAADTRVDRRVAVKVLAADRVALRPDHLERFQREARAIARLNHPHICTLYDVGEQDGHTFLVMEYLEGETLASRLRSGALPFDVALRYAIVLADAVGFAHQAGIVHRDIKPSNIIVTPTGPKLLDFGLAKLIDPGLPSTTDLHGATTQLTVTRDDVIVGTLAYMSPEQVQGAPADTRSDVFALGLVIYEMIAGSRPAPNAAPLHVVQPAASEELSRIVQTCLKANPNERWQSAADVARALTAVSTVPGTPAGGLSSRSRTGAWIAVAAVVIIAAIGASSAWWRRSSAPQSGSLVVLPCRAVADDALGQAYCDGLVDVLAARLTPLTVNQHLQITSPIEVRQRRISAAADARKMFGATLVIEGSIARVADDWRVNYALVDTATLKQLAAFTATTQASDPFSLQERIARWGVDALSLEVTTGQREALTRHDVDSPRAYDLYLKARGYLAEQARPADLDTAIDLLRKAIEVDANSAAAHASLGSAYRLMYDRTHDAAWIDRATHECDRAATLDPDSKEANVCLGAVRQRTGSYALATEAYERALKRDESDDEAVIGLASAQEQSGHLADAEATFKRAVSLRPQYWAPHTRLGSFYRNRGRYQEAAGEYRRAVKLTPDNPQPHLVLGVLNVYLGDYAAGIVEFRRAIELGPSVAAYSNWGMTLYRMRQFGAAVEKLEAARGLDPNNYRTLSNLARAYDRQGRRDRVIETCAAVERIGGEELAVNPRNPETHALIADCEARAGNRTGARAHIAASGVTVNDDPHLVFFVSMIFNQLDERDTAIDWLRHAAANGLPAPELGAWIDVDNIRDAVARNGPRGNR